VLKANKLEGFLGCLYVLSSCDPPSLHLTRSPVHPPPPAEPPSERILVNRVHKSLFGSFLLVAFVQFLHLSEIIYRSQHKPDSFRSHETDSKLIRGKYPVAYMGRELKCFILSFTREGCRYIIVLKSNTMCFH